MIQEKSHLSILYFDTFSDLQGNMRIGFLRKAAFFFFFFWGGGGGGGRTACVNTVNHVNPEHYMDEE